MRRKLKQFSSLLTHFNLVPSHFLSMRPHIFPIWFFPTVWRTKFKNKTNVKLSLCFYWAPPHEGVLGEWRYSFIHSLSSALDGGEWSASRPGRFTPSERAPGTHWIGGWMGPRAVLYAVAKRKIPRPRRESNPRNPIIQPVAQSCTYWAITTSTIQNNS
jgi:hypothetical protein